MGTTLVDQIDDNNKKATSKWGKHNVITPSPNNGKNGIPTLISSDGLNKPAVEPQALADGAGASGYVGGPTISASESFVESSSRDVTLDIMKNNLNYCRVHANDIFNNLKLQCEWDSTSLLIHILIQFKDSIKENFVESDDLYPYPLDITIPFDMDPIIIYNSKSSISEPDMDSQESGEGSPFNASFWASDNDNELLTLVLKDQLDGLDNALKSFDESYIYESFSNDSLELVDRKDVPDENGDESFYDWYMDENQYSYFYYKDKEHHKEEDPDKAQDWFDSFLGFNKEDEISNLENNLDEEGEDMKIQESFTEEVVDRKTMVAKLSDAYDRDSSSSDIIERALEDAGLDSSHYDYVDDALDAMEEGDLKSLYDTLYGKGGDRYRKFKSMLRGGGIRYSIEDSKLEIMGYSNGWSVTIDLSKIDEDMFDTLAD